MIDINLLIWKGEAVQFKKTCQGFTVTGAAITSFPVRGAEWEQNTSGSL